MITTMFGRLVTGRTLRHPERSFNDPVERLSEPELRQDVFDALVDRPAVSTRISGDVGASYGAEIPLNSGISPARALA